MATGAGQRRPRRARPAAAPWRSPAKAAGRHTGGGDGRRRGPVWDRRGKRLIGPGGEPCRKNGDGGQRLGWKEIRIR
jgi:hypothetical protein